MIYRYKQGMGTNPASVNLRTGVVSINPQVWNKLSGYERAIILLHEEGHYKQQTLDEIKADIYAIDKYLNCADTPLKRQQLIETIFKIVPDDRRKLSFVKNLLQYESNANEDKRARAMVEAIGDYEAAAIGAAAIISIAQTALSLVSYGVEFWQQIKNKETYWRNYKSEKKEQIITEATKTAICAKFYEKGGSFSALSRCIELPPTDRDSLAFATFSIIAQGVKFDVDYLEGAIRYDSSGKGHVIVEQASAIFWSKQGYQLQSWFTGWANKLRTDMEQIWSEMPLIEKIKLSRTYQIYLLCFAAAAFAIWKWV